MVLVAELGADAKEFTQGESSGRAKRSILEGYGDKRQASTVKFILLP